jgi:uncharacterized protein (DUF697 family)/uncharacterized tellurite resistance protein B-like protein
MTEQEQRAILNICFMAALADGATEVERAAIQGVATNMGASGVDLNALYQDAASGRASVAAATSQLSAPEVRKSAYETAVAICNADGAANEAEQKFLRGLRDALKLPVGDADKVQQQANAVATTSVVAATPVDAAELDKAILNYSILNGALELLPESLGTLAIIPMQMKMVYQIGKSHGYELNAGYVKDFAGTLGIGLTSQVVEGVARKLLGSILGVLGRQTASSAVAFVTTYALGQVAKRYYAGGRKLQPGELKQLYTQLTGDAKNLSAKYTDVIKNKVNELRGRSIADVVKQA